jgi:hypothetical protein
VEMDDREVADICVRRIEYVVRQKTEGKKKIGKISCSVSQKDVKASLW